MLNLPNPRAKQFDFAIPDVLGSAATQQFPSGILRISAILA
jgi:hypothetical protein